MEATENARVENVARKYTTKIGLHRWNMQDWKMQHDRRKAKQITLETRMNE